MFMGKVKNCIKKFKVSNVCNYVDNYVDVCCFGNILFDVASKLGWIDMF